ncbi:MAG: hypothetical protein ACOYZ8_14200 [Chloroflexota bacterium]
MIVKPFSARHTAENFGDRFLISIPSKKNWFQMVFLFIWLAGWAFGEVMVGDILLAVFLKNSVGVPILFLFVWLAGWTAGGVFALYALLWQLAGKEIIEINGQAIRIGRSIFGIHFPKEYTSQYIKDLRVSTSMPPDMFGWSRTFALWGLGPGMIAFDYGAKTIRFSSGVDEAEAKQIISEILQNYPQYKNK